MVSRCGSWLDLDANQMFCLLFTFGYTEIYAHNSRIIYATHDIRIAVCCMVKRRSFNLNVRLVSWSV